jgi:hypothetical protein
MPLRLDNASALPTCPQLQQKQQQTADQNWPRNHPHDCAKKRFLKRSNFNTFVKGLIRGTAFNDPYFVVFYHLILSIAANAEAIGWNRDCDFIFDDQGKIGKNAVSQWDWMKQNIDGANAANVSAYLGPPPIFRDDVKFLPLQAADMLAWLVRDCLTIGGSNMEEISRTALKHLAAIMQRFDGYAAHASAHA